MGKYTRLILMIAWALSSGAARADLRAALRSALGNYCIPGDEKLCSSSSTERADYVPAGAPGTNKCKCRCDDMMYDAASRKCVECDPGSAGRYATACAALSCPTGYRAVEVTGCPAGMKMIDKARPCNAIDPVCGAGQKMVNI